jgi:hypothetical protein
MSTLTDIGESYPEPSISDLDHRRIVSFLQNQGIDVLEEDDLFGDDYFWQRIR